MKRTKFPNGNGKNKRGRPTDYREDMPERAFSLCLLGLREEDLAMAFGVSEVTLNAWKNAHPEFLKAIKKGGEPADATVARSLYQRAIGFSHPDVHISNYQGIVTITPITKHYPPETMAGMYWLNNRQRGRFQNVNRQELTGPNGGPIQIQPTPVELGDFTDEELKLAVSMGSKIKLLTDGKNGGNGDSDSGKD